MYRYTFIWVDEPLDIHRPEDVDWDDYPKRVTTIETTSYDPHVAMALFREPHDSPRVITKVTRESIDMDTAEYIEGIHAVEATDQYDNVPNRVNESVRLMHAVFGLNSEAGELMEMYKKHLFYGKDIDQTNLLEEIGDIMWYLYLLIDQLAMEHGVSPSEMEQRIKEANYMKLKTRYPEGFNEEKAKVRDTQAERKAIEEATSTEEGEAEHATSSNDTDGAEVSESSEG